MSLDTSHCADCNVEFPGSWAMFGPAHAPVCWACWEKRARRRALRNAEATGDREYAAVLRLLDADAQEATR